MIVVLKAKDSESMYPDEGLQLNWKVVGRSVMTVGAKSDMEENSIVVSFQVERRKSDARSAVRRLFHRDNHGSSSSSVEPPTGSINAI